LTQAIFGQAIVASLRSGLITELSSLTPVKKMVPTHMKVLAAALHLSAYSAAASCMDTGSCVMGGDETSLLQVKGVLESGVERVSLSSSVGCPAECSERAEAEEGEWRIPCRSMRMKQCQVCNECKKEVKGVTFGGTSGAERGASSCPTTLGLYPLPSGKNPLWAEFVESVLDRRAHPNAVDGFCGPRHLVRHELRYCCSRVRPSAADLKEQACRVLATTGSGFDNGSDDMAGTVADHREEYDRVVPLLGCPETIEEPHGEGFADDVHHQASAPRDEVHSDQVEPVSADESYARARQLHRELQGDREEPEPEEAPAQRPAPLLPPLSRVQREAQEKVDKARAKVNWPALQRPAREEPEQEEAPAQKRLPTPAEARAKLGWGPPPQRRQN